MTIQYNENHDLCDLNNVNAHVHNNYAIDFRYSTNASIFIDDVLFSAMDSTWMKYVRLYGI